MSRSSGIRGTIADRMIRRTVRVRFHGVYWIPPKRPLPEPCILAPNRHGWHDGYVMYHVITALGLRTLTWIQELDAVPSLEKLGGLPFPQADTSRRAATIRQTVRHMNEEQANLLLFAEPNLHAPPEVMPFGKGLDFVASHVPGATVLPVAIRYEMALHERPECYILFGTPVSPGDALGARTRLAVKSLLDELAMKIRFEPDAFLPLAKGTNDVNEPQFLPRIPRL